MTYSILSENRDTQGLAQLDAELCADPYGAPRPEGARPPQSRNAHQLMALVAQTGRGR